MEFSKNKSHFSRRIDGPKIKSTPMENMNFVSTPNYQKLYDAIYILKENADGI